MAVTPSSQNAERVLAKIAADGSFDLELDPARPWVLVFVDAGQVGADMIIGVFKAQSLDTLPPAKTAGKVDLGTVTVSGGSAASDVSYSALLAALGLDPATAEDIGAVDDQCLRYVSPDIDGDGVLDMEQPGHGFGLDFHAGFALMANGHSATVADIIGDFLPADTAISYGGTGIYVSYPSSFAPAGAGQGVTFDEPATVQTFGPDGGSLRTVAAGVAITDVIANNYGDYASFGVFAAAGHDLPQGTYRFGVGAETLTFTHVRTHSDAELAAAANFIMPFVRLAPVDPACRSACAIAAIDYAWRKRTSTGWVPATVADLALITGDQGGFVSIRRHDDGASDGVGFVIPNQEVSGTIPWTASAGNLAGIDGAALAAMTTDDVCHFGLSYDDKLGTRFFGAIGNTPGTCGQ